LIYICHSISSYRHQIFFEGAAWGAIHIQVYPGDEKGYIAECIDLPVVSQGTTVDEALKNIREAIELHLQDEDPEALGISTTAPILTTLQLAPLHA
jgi:predicted RNase H-like HicB family nuclease